MDWVEKVADSKDARDYRRRVEDSETASVWQSLGFGPNYKAAYCMAACPAGDDVIGPFLADRKGFLKEVVNPLQEKEEPVYVIPGSDAEAYVTRRFPHKRPRRVGGGRRPRSIRSFLFVLPHSSSGTPRRGWTPRTISRSPARSRPRRRSSSGTSRSGSSRGTSARPTSASSPTAAPGSGFLAKERSLVWAILRRKVRLKGSPRLLVAFGKCFPS